MSWNFSVRQGGLMRCCIHTLHNTLRHLSDMGQGQPANGERIRCAHHDSYMIRAEDGIWEWDHE